MIVKRLQAVLARDEGKNLKRHKVDGIWHIGIGRNLEGRGLTQEELDELGYDDEDDIQKITEEQCEYLFQNDLALSLDICDSIFGDEFNNFSPVRQECFMNLAFNLGGPRLRRFSQMIAAALEGDWEEAADEMLDSKAARTQAPDRYNRLAKALEFDDHKYFEVDDELWFDWDAAEDDAMDQRARENAEDFANEFNEGMSNKMAEMDAKLDNIIELLTKNKRGLF